MISLNFHQQTCGSERHIETRSWVNAKTITLSVSEQSDFAATQPNSKTGGFSLQHTRYQADESTSTNLKVYYYYYKQKLSFSLN